MTSLFTGKASLYDRYRPSYPSFIISHLRKKTSLSKRDLIAEFGFGTGKLTRLLLQNGNQVFGIEPENEMQELFLEKYARNTKFTLIPGSAEKNELKNESVDVIVAAQSFHLFDPIKTRDEFYRVIKQNGFIILIWYHLDRDNKISKEILSLFYRFGFKSNQPGRTHIGETFFNDLFSPNIVSHTILPSFKQSYNQNDFLGSMLSSSYAPTFTDNYYEDYIAEINSLFTRFSTNGIIEYKFKLELYYLKVTTKNG